MRQSHTAHPTEPNILFRIINAHIQCGWIQKSNRAGAGLQLLAGGLNILFLIIRLLRPILKLYAGDMVEVLQIRRYHDEFVINGT